MVTGLSQIVSKYMKSGTDYKSLKGLVRSEVKGSTVKQINKEILSVKKNDFMSFKKWFLDQDDMKIKALTGKQSFSMRMQVRLKGIFGNEDVNFWTTVDNVNTDLRVKDLKMITAYDLDEGMQTSTDKEYYLANFGGVEVY